ncbi:MAG: 3-oxoacyl-[acyl-carrier-protein] reductase [Dethiobacteria bacterium]
MRKLEGKVALVTGGSRGIGRAIVKALANEGASLAINYQQNKTAAQEVLDIIEADGGRGILIKGNVADRKSCDRMVLETIDYYGRIDILINNAGITRDNIMVIMKQEEWEDVIRINLTGVFNCCQAVIRPLLKQKSGGRIINISSIAGIYGNSGQANYAASKDGVIALTKSLSKELGSRGITVNAVAPGFIETEMTAQLSDKIKEDSLKRIPLGRIGRPEDVAEAVLFFAAEANYITGQVLPVDGGLVL